MNTVKTFSFPNGNGRLVSSTPISGRAVTEAFNFSWPSPVTQDHQMELQLTEKSSAEKVQQWVESQEFTSHTPDTSLERQQLQKFTKLSVIEDTDEEDEMIVPDVKNSKSLLVNNSPSKKSYRLHVQFSKIKPRKEVGNRRSKGAANSQKKTQKSSEPQLEITEESEYNIIKDQRQRTQNEYSQRNMGRAHEKKQDEETVELDHKIDPKQKKNLSTEQTAVTEDSQNEENEERILLTEQKQEKQSLRKTRSGRLNLSQQPSPNKSTHSTNIQDVAPETELPAVTENTDDRRAQKSKSPKESQSAESINSGKGRTSRDSRKRLLFSHEKTSFSVSEVSINRKSPKKHAYSYSFLEETDCVSKGRSKVLRRKPNVRARGNSNNAKKSQNVTKTKNRSNIAESALKGKRQFNSKEEVAENLRRSKRTRVKPLAHWIGERLCYKSGPDLCFEIVGIERACSAEPSHRQRNNMESEYIAFSIPLQNKEKPELKRLQITNEGRKQDLECFSTLRPDTITKGFSKYRMLDSAVTEAGLIKLASFTKKIFKASPAHYVFFILKGHALVQVHNMTQEVKPGELFQVPKGISYSIENLSKNQMVIHFVMVK